MVILKPEPKGYTYYKVPKYPDFPLDEWKARINKTQRLMAENSVDCMIFWSRPNIRYFYGFQTIHWQMPSIQPAVGIIPVDGEPILIVSSLFKGNAEALCWVRDIRTLENPHERRSIRALPKEVGDIVKEIGYGSKNIGLEMGPLGCTWIPRPLNDIETLKNALPDAKFVDGDKVIWGCRLIKSPLEIERIKGSVNATTAVLSAVVEEYRPGMTQVDVGRIMHRAAAEQPCDRLGDDVISGFGHYTVGTAPMADLGPIEGVMINKGDAIGLDITCEYKGYRPDIARVFQTCPITDKIKKWYEKIWEGEDMAVDILRPGVKAKELFDVMYKPLKSAGVPILDMGGHSVGLDWHEPPDIDASEDFVMQEGMTLSIEPWAYTDIGWVGIQDTFVVTDKGCYQIEALKREIIQVSTPNT